MNPYLLIHRIKGPAMLLVFGITALLNEWDIISFGKSWPLYLIVLGVLQLAERAAWSQWQQQQYAQGQYAAQRRGTGGEHNRPLRLRWWCRHLICRPTPNAVMIRARGGSDMAASPPPPYSPSPQDSRRQARDYARAQREQARAQRHYWRHWYGYRRASIVGPCLLLAIGIIALLLETGHLSAAQFWTWYARWWPVLLIGVGLVSLG